VCFERRCRHGAPFAASARCFSASTFTSFDPLIRESAVWISPSTMSFDFVRAVIAFAVGTAVLAGLFAFLGATLAAVLELTAGAGLVSVLFLVAITLTQGREEEVRG